MEIPDTLPLDLDLLELEVQPAPQFRPIHHNLEANIPKASSLCLLTRSTVGELSLAKPVESMEDSQIAGDSQILGSKLVITNIT